MHREMTRPQPSILTRSDNFDFNIIFGSLTPISQRFAAPSICSYAMYKLSPFWLADRGVFLFFSSFLFFVFGIRCHTRSDSRLQIRRLNPAVLRKGWPSMKKFVLVTSGAEAPDGGYQSSFAKLMIDSLHKAEVPVVRQLRH